MVSGHILYFLEMLILLNCCVEEMIISWHFELACKIQEMGGMSWESFFVILILGNI